MDKTTKFEIKWKCNDRTFEYAVYAYGMGGVTRTLRTIMVRKDFQEITSIKETQ